MTQNKMYKVKICCCCCCHLNYFSIQITDTRIYTIYAFKYIDSKRMNQPGEINIYNQLLFWIFWRNYNSLNLVCNSTWTTIGHLFCLRTRQRANCSNSVVVGALVWMVFHIVGRPYKVGVAPAPGNSSFRVFNPPCSFYVYKQRVEIKKERKKIWGGQTSDEEQTPRAPSSFFWNVHTSQS